MTPVRLQRVVAPMLLTSVAMVVASALAAVVLQRPYLVELGLPFLVVLVVGLLLDGPAEVEVTVELTSERILEDDVTEVLVTLRGRGPGGRVVIDLPAPAGVTYAKKTPAVREVRLPAEGVVVVRYRLEQPPWGVHRWQPLTVRVPAPLGLVSYEGSAVVDAVLRVLPLAEALEQLARSSRTGVVAGARVAGAKAAGFEFADIRDFVPGDRRRDVNWRATARRGELRVNDHHPERSTDVVLLLDAFPSAGLPSAVRATVALATAYLAERDRVGLVRFGTSLEWVTPAMGARALYRIVDTLLEASVHRGVAWENLRRLPQQALPSTAMVLAVTPLADLYSMNTVTQVAAQGLRVAVIEVAAESVAEPGTTPAERLAYAMWLLELEENRDRFRDRGVPIVAWDVREPLAPVVEEVAAFQRYARHRTG
ncbi:DUF58 domain-containing protein [Acidothermaceae bacterium B102]|nr:DUF58 domain-containing protein [Acidothermaceae bacterium B102]